MPANERREERDPVFVKARCRTSRWHVADAALSDISPKGCCITTRAPLEVGQTVEIRQGTNKGFSGTVRWLSELQAGIQFATPLGDDELAELLSEHRVRSSKVAQLRLKP